jgi:uncharacterized protein (DUF169 family)
VSVLQELVRLLDLAHPPLALTFHHEEPAELRGSRPGPEPAGCCFWQEAEERRLVTTAADHAHCSVGSYTHGFVSLDQAASGEDTAALVGSGWVTEADLRNTAHVASVPAAISYEPLDEADDPDVVLIRLTASSLMTLQGAHPELAVTIKPQCQIVPLALEGTIAVSPGCAVSRVRTGQPANELTCALPARDLDEIVARLARSRAADAAVSAYADHDLRENFPRPA